MKVCRENGHRWANEAHRKYRNPIVLSQSEYCIFCGETRVLKKNPNPLTLEERVQVIEKRLGIE